MPAAGTSTPPRRLTHHGVDNDDVDSPRQQLKILSPLPKVPWDHPTGAGGGCTPPPAQQEGGIYRRTRTQQRKLHFETEQQQQQQQHSVSPRQHHRVTLKREDAPPYLLGNPYILSGFRQCATLREAVDGLFYQHNSWLDSWTSVFSFVHSHVLLAVGAWKLGVFGHDALSSTVFALFYIHVAWVHAPASIACHLIGNAGISQHVHELSLECDYICIFTASVLLAFTQAVFVYPWWLTVANVACALGLTAYLATHLRQVVLCHIGRLRMLLEIGALYQLPLWVQAFRDYASGYPPSPTFSVLGLPLSLLLACGVTGSLAMGGMTYALHFPEVLAPGKFDIWWNSHALMHVWINVAMFCEWAFLVHMFTRSAF